MAYTTQKDVIKVGFLNQTLDPTCLKKAGVALKSYASTTDVRAFDSRRLKQAQYLADLVACRTYAGDHVTSGSGIEEGHLKSKPTDKGDHNDGDDDFSEDILSEIECFEKKCHSNHANLMPASTSSSTDNNKVLYSEQNNKMNSNITKDIKNIVDRIGNLGYWASQTMKISDTDSLLARTTQKLTDFEDLLKENKKLKDELICSADELKNLKEENNKIKNILKNGDPSKIVEFEDKVIELKKSGKIDSNDVEVLLKLRRQIGDRQKAIEIIEAENNALKRLAEKLSTRAKIPEIMIENETNTDVMYLQQTVNSLKHEIGILRTMEDEFTKTKIDFVSMKQKYDSMTEQQKQDLITKDVDRIKTIIDERNKLRHQLDKMIGIEGKIAKLREKAMKADELEKELQEFKSGSKFALESLQDCKKVLAENTELKKRLENIKGNDNESTSCAYKRKIDEMNKTIQDATIELQKAQNENCCLRRKLQSSANTIEDYECQMHQLMCVVNELRIAMMSKMNEMRAFDVNKEELISTSKTCLQQIRKELEIRCALEKELDKCKKDLFDLQKLYDKERQKSRRSSELKKRESVDISPVQMSSETEDQSSPVTDELKQSEERLGSFAQKSIPSTESFTVSERPISPSTAPSIASSAEFPAQKQITQISIQDELSISDKQLIKLHTKEKIQEKESSPKIELSTIEEKLEPVHEFEVAIRRKESLKENEIERSEPEEMMNVLRENLEKCRENLMEFEKKIYDLEKELDSCRLENDQLKEKNKLLKNESDRIDEVLELRNMLQKEKENYEMKTREYEDLKSKFENLRRNLDEKLTESGQQEEKMSVMNLDYERIKTELESQKKLLSDARDEVEQYQKEINKYVEHVRNLKQQNEECKMLNLKYENQLNEKDIEMNTLRDKYLELEEKLESVYKEDAKRISECDKIKSALEKAENDLERLQVNVNDIELKNKHLQAIIAEREEEISKLKKELELGEAEKEKMRLIQSTQFENMKIEKDRLNAEIVDKDDKIEKLNASLSKKNTDIKDLRLENENLNEQLSKIRQELDGLESEKNRLNELINDKNIDVTNLKAEKSKLNEQIRKLNMDFNNLKGERDSLLEQVNNKDEEMRDLRNQLEKVKDDIKNLKIELEICQKEKSELAGLIGEIEKEREKNKNLQNMLNDFESKLTEVPKKLSTEGVGGLAVNNLQDAINKLKNQLENEKARNNELFNELKQCKDKLQMAFDEGRVEGPIKGSFDMESIRLTVDKALDNLKREHMASLKKLQDMHEKQLQDLNVGHDREIRTLQIANEAMRNSLVNIRQKMESNICKCDKKSGFLDDSLLTKLQCICKKILDAGIECLSLAELTYLHTEVYKAGLKLRPELLKCANISNIPKCCKCAGFACCLPSLPREKEKIFVERIVNLEKDVDNANKILQYLKMHCDNKIKPSASTNNSKERYHSFRPNDEINKLLKKVSHDKICSTRRPVSKRK